MLTLPGRVIVILSLVGAWAVGVAQPLLDLLGRNAAFLVAHDATAGDTLLLVVVLTLLAPLLLAAIVLLVRRLSPSVAVGLLGACLAVLAAIFCLVVLQLAGVSARLPGSLTMGLAAGLGTAFAAAYLTWQRLRVVVSVTAVVAPVVALLFVAASPARSLVLPVAPSGTAAALRLPEDPPTIVMLLVDELPLATLLDQDGAILDDVFPNFARLAGDATLLRNVTTVHGQTSDAVPALLSSRYPRADALPLAADHPGNLFSLLGGTYQLHVEEPITQLCSGRCGTGSQPFLGRQIDLYSDLAVVAGHLVLPRDLAADLPPLDQGWRDFRSAAAEEGKEGAVTQRFREARRTSPVPTFKRFVDGIHATGRPTLHYIHTLLPHSPWRYLPDGSSYAGIDPPAGLERGRWTSDPWPPAQGFQRHLLQTQLADRLLGTLLDRLEAEGVYDDALVVVAADHGASFAPDTSLRVISEQTIPEIARVPVLLKAPGQTQAAVSDRSLETIDVLPTMLDLIDADVPDGLLRGFSAFDDTVVDRTTRQFFSPRGDVAITAATADISAVVRRKLAWFPPTASPDGFVFGLAPAGRHRLLGSTVRTAETAGGGWTNGGAACGQAPPPGPRLPTLLCATLRVEGDDSRALHDVALAIDDRVIAVTRVAVQGLGTGPIRALLPPDVTGRNVADLQVLLVGDDGALRDVPRKAD